jgi:hypothetical protein
MPTGPAGASGWWSACSDTIGLDQVDLVDHDHGAATAQIWPRNIHSGSTDWC